MSEEITRQIRVYGIVRGKFRPTVGRYAVTWESTEMSVTKVYVKYLCTGDEEKNEGFITEIQNNPPWRTILKINNEKIENSRSYTQFDIIEAEKTKRVRKFCFSDIAICENAREMFDRRIGDICIRLSTAPVADET